MTEKGKMVFGQLYDPSDFDGKPDDEVCSILKANGFRWAPSQQA